jgi:hypothetical protein
MQVSSDLRWMQNWPEIKDYSIIGDCRSTALVSRNGSIDWLCWPRFDKPSIFAAILDRERGGYWRISPVEPATIERKYVPDSNVLETRFTSPHGSVILTDLMPVIPHPLTQDALLPDHEIIRKVACVTGELELAIEFSPRADYGKQAVVIRECGRLGLRIVVGRGVYWLRSSIPLLVKNGSAHARVVVCASETLRFSFTYSEEAPAVLRPLDQSLDNQIDQSESHWQQW